MNVKQAQVKPWQFRVFSLFLLLQAIALFIIGMNGLSMIRLEGILSQSSTQNDLARHVFTYTVFLVMAIPLLPAAFGFFFRLRFAWFLSMLSQALLLSFCLYLYFNWKPLIIYPIMASSSIMVFYLNSFSVRAHFHTSLDLRELKRHGER